MAFARRARRAVLPVATRFHGAFCMGAAQRDSPSDCAAEWVRAKNDARRVKPLRFANFPRAAARLAQQAALHLRQFHQTSRRGERVCRRQGLWLSRVARGDAILPVATKFHGAFCMGAAQRDFSGDCAAEWVRAKNAARRVKPLRFANFPRAESAFCTAGSKRYGVRASRTAGYPAGCHEVSRRVLHGRGATGFSRRLRSGVGASEERCPARKAAAFCKLFACGGAIGAAGGTSSAPVSPTSRAQRARLQAAKVMVFARRARRRDFAGCHEVSRRVLHGARRGGIFSATAQRSRRKRSTALPGRETRRPRVCLEKEKPAMAGDVPPVSAKHAQASWRKVQNLQRHNGAKNAEIAIQESFKHTPARP